MTVQDKNQHNFLMFLLLSAVIMASSLVLVRSVGRNPGVVEDSYSGLMMELEGLGEDGVDSDLRALDTESSGL